MSKKTLIPSKITLVSALDFISFLMFSSKHPLLNMRFILFPLSILLWPQVQASTLFFDDFEDGINSGWDYRDRSNGTPNAPPSTIPSVPYDPPVFTEAGGSLNQTSTSYRYPTSITGIYSPRGASLGSLALIQNQIFTDSYEISVDFTSLEPINRNQDHSIVFSYVDEENFVYVELINGMAAAFLHTVVDGIRYYNPLTTPRIALEFQHETTNAKIHVNTASNAVSVSYDGGPLTAFDTTGISLTAGQIGFGSNNDAFAIDNVRITAIPEPNSLFLIAFCALVTTKRRRKAA
ncbi:MAG: hypothetical protein ACQKBY_01435 [Verrucomicrobiales bacterium]